MSHPSATRDSRLHRDTYGREAISGSVISPRSYDINRPTRTPGPFTPGSHVKIQTTPQKQQTKAMTPSSRHSPSIKESPPRKDSYQKQKDDSPRHESTSHHSRSKDSELSSYNYPRSHAYPSHSKDHHSGSSSYDHQSRSGNRHSYAKDNNTGSREYRSHNNDYYTRRKDNSSDHIIYQYLLHPDITEAEDSDASYDNDIPYDSDASYDTDTTSTDIDQLFAEIALGIRDTGVRDVRARRPSDFILEELGRDRRFR